MEKEIINSISTKQDTFHAVEAEPVPTKDVPVFHQNLSEQGVFLRATDTVPTDVPSDPLDKFRLYVNGTDIRFYVYDTVNGAWRNVTGGSSNIWQDMGSATADGTSPTLNLTFTTSYTYVRIYVDVLGHDQSGSTNDGYSLTFNNETGTRYCQATMQDGGASAFTALNNEIRLTNSLCNGDGQILGMIETSQVSGNTTDSSIITNIAYRYVNGVGNPAILSNRQTNAYLSNNHGTLTSVQFSTLPGSSNKIKSGSIIRAIGHN